MNHSIGLHIRVNVRLGNDPGDKFLTGLCRSFSEESIHEGLPACQSMRFFFKLL